jgi:hypothetical protein
VRAAAAAAALWVLAFTAAATASDMRFASVFTAKGAAEVRESPAGDWKAARRDAALPTGASLRTGKDAGACVVFDFELDHALCLGPDSEIEMLRTPDHVRLKRGRAYLVLESGHAGPLAQPGLSILTVLAGDLRVHMSRGGAVVDLGKRGEPARLRVFGGSAKVSRSLPAGAKSRITSVGEGFALSSSGSELGFARMPYADYAEWNSWVKTWYEAKDDELAERFEKEVGL